MRVKQTKSKNTINYAIIKDINVAGKRSTTIVENLGNHETLQKAHPETDPLTWAKQRAAELTALDKADNTEFLLAFNQKKRLKLDKPHEFNGGYLFLQKIYYDLGLHNIARTIQKKHKITFSMDDILSRLIYGRILSPSSKRSTREFSKTLLESKDIDLHHFYRGLETLCEESDTIQEELYKHSKESRKTHVLYYDCTNFYFEIEDEDADDGLRKYGPSKESRPNPIVELGLFMDANGIPLAFDIHPGNQNEQTTLKPLEKKIIKDFQQSKFVVCTDAGLSSRANKQYNTLSGRAYVTTQSVKKLNRENKDWALSREGWRVVGGNPSEFFSLDQIESDPASPLYHCTFYKECPFPEKDLPEQRLIVTFSMKYKQYHQAIREQHIQRAMKYIKNPASFDRKRQTDCKRLIKSIETTLDGEVAATKHLLLDEDKIAEESRYDGIYAVSTNLDDTVETIVKINQRRWEIEESFRIMKKELKSRPVYLSKATRIKAHFLTCFLALTVFRFLEHKLDDKFTCCEILETLRNFRFQHINGAGFIPAYTRTTLTDKLHESFGFHTDFEIISEKKMKNIYKQSKS